jgi:uncharacterized protein YihD (DUF1040 family)
MFMRALALLVTVVGLCAACDCREPSVAAKRNDADLVFRGTIVELRKSTKPTNIRGGFGRDRKETVVFRVSRVWKGQVSQMFEMRAIEETAACVGFWPPLLKLGEDLLVYAKRIQGSDYLTDICGNHKPAEDAGNDFKILGPGQEPARSAQK